MYHRIPARQVTGGPVLVVDGLGNGGGSSGTAHAFRLVWDR